MNLFNSFSFLSKILKDAKVKKFIKNYGMAIFLQLISIIGEAEQVFKQSGQGKQKLEFVLNKFKDILNTVEDVEEGDQVPEWVTKLITTLITISNNFFK